MSEKRRGLGRGLGALIPTASDAQRPVDVFFPDVTGAVAAREASRSAARVEATTAVLDDPDPLAEFETDLGPATASGRGTATKGAGVPRETVDAHVPREPGDDGVLRGSGNLIPVPGARFAELPVHSVRPNARQPRTVFDEDALDELASSIREIGVLQPIVVRPARDGVAGYELVMGERRWRASQRAGLATVPAIVRETEDEDLLRDALLENLHRSQLNPLEEAAAYQQLLDDFGCTHEELATRISRSRPQISNTLRLLRLPPLVQRRVAAGVLSAGHARALLGLTDGAAIERLAQRIVAEGLSVRATEEIVALGADSGRGAPVGRRTRTHARAEAAEALAARLSDRFETRVKVALGRSKGRITVEFASVEDLNRILATLSPEDAGLLQA